jgi:hypothetical protein
MKNSFFNILFAILFIILIVIFLKFMLTLALVGLVLLWLRSWQVQRDPRQNEFLQGTVPNPKPDGLYQGGARFLGSWRGKTFNAAENTGINRFDDGKGNIAEKYVFTTFEADALLDRKKVLKINYRLPQNPWWARFIEDELVQTGEGQYLGKLLLKIIPGFPFAALYFTLKK